MSPPLRRTRTTRDAKMAIAAYVRRAGLVGFDDLAAEFDRRGYERVFFCRALRRAVAEGHVREAGLMYWPRSRR